MYGFIRTNSSRINPFYPWKPTSGGCNPYRREPYDIPMFTTTTTVRTYRKPAQDEQEGEPILIKEGTWELEIPGAEDINVTYLGRRVTVEFTKKGVTDDFVGVLPEDYDIQTGQASYEKGVLTLAFEEAIPGRIHVDER